MIAAEDKRKIAARAFFHDDNEYEDFHEAETEFMALNHAEAFIDFVCEPYLKPKPGHSIVMRGDGHLATVREVDGFFEPVFDMTDKEGEEVMEAFNEAAEKHPGLDGLPLLLKTGWKILVEAHQ
jgi:hypothetical protein